MVDGEDKTRIQGVADSIIKYIKDISCDKNVYQAKMDLITCRKCVSSILSKIRKYISPRFSEDSVGLIPKRSTDTNIDAKIALAVFDTTKVVSKAFVRLSYDRILCFCTSVAA